MPRLVQRLDVVVAKPFVLATVPPRGGRVLRFEEKPGDERRGASRENERDRITPSVGGPCDPGPDRYGSPPEACPSDPPSPGMGDGDGSIVGGALGVGWGVTDGSGVGWGSGVSFGSGSAGSLS